ncbi:hypothetical protein BWI17_03260 [Betaproteobacteria bacterium GR16-43]|nr:hypothetical protein BWI17_03260 [Betaproteobacteria bacterium GR16-43]
MKRFLAAALLSVIAVAPAWAQAPAAKATRVLFIGNSLTYETDIPGRVAKVAKATGRNVVVESIAYPAFSLEDHWRDGRAMEAIKKGWDYVVLQQGTSGQEDARRELIEMVKRFDKPIRATGAKTAVYMVWPLSDRPKEWPDVMLSYRMAAKGADAILIPAGEAWFRALSKDPRLKLYSDPIHPSSFGSDLATLTIYLTLFPAGPQEFNEAFVKDVARVLEIPDSRRDAFFDAATLAIDSPLTIK